MYCFGIHIGKAKGRMCVEGVEGGNPGRTGSMCVSLVAGTVASTWQTPVPRGVVTVLVAGKVVVKRKAVATRSTSVQLTQLDLNAPCRTAVVTWSQYKGSCAGGQPSVAE